MRTGARLTGRPQLPGTFWGARANPTTETQTPVFLFHCNRSAETARPLKFKPLDEHFETKLANGLGRECRGAAPKVL